ncbi:uncharacterized protein K489DRAFT_140859 [Dissoconium aciculare CBS 342.82]|jgi:hypothetical protein|uniref:Uncharacterized protein n=1 Tax=Dissoconium aciculare CBS 342.82 TaxID=1314786 RepID=A0A6J3LT52_9PEZI|nr:uncharacterized protein K489DRAFT_140859 [Dissoconium aciculare CBS 342.82]KAF1817792.1 hypothetical protein K489DRAFT_140859 [Dissoconium aciculare CBS 342.82]
MDRILYSKMMILISSLLFFHSSLALRTPLTLVTTARAMVTAPPAVPITRTTIAPFTKRDEINPGNWTFSIGPQDPEQATYFAGHTTKVVQPTYGTEIESLLDDAVVAAWASISESGYLLEVLASVVTTMTNVETAVYLIVNAVGTHPFSEVPNTVWNSILFETDDTYIHELNAPQEADYAVYSQSGLAPESTLVAEVDIRCTTVAL